MSYDADAIKASTDIVAVVNSYVTLTKKGREYVGLCPFHADTKPSFWVVPEKRFCHCFSCDANYDVISFLQEIEGIDFKAACERLGGKNEWVPRKIGPSPKPEPKLPERVTSKPPADAPTPNMAIRGLGEPSRIWPYKDIDGGLLGYVARYDSAEKKEIRCWTWGARGTAEPSWGCGHWNRPRPLYGLHRLSEASTAPVLVVEGEKAAEAAQALLPQYAVITWPGGAKAWKHADWNPLRGRRVDLWPDNDEPGIAAMQGLRSILEDVNGLACHGKFVDPNRMPEGFDAADWDQSHGDIIAWLRARATEYPEKTQPSPAPEEGPPSPPIEAYADEGSGDGDDNDAVAMSEDMISGRFVDEHGENLRYVKMWNSWFVWENDGWRRDETALVDRLAVELTRKAQYWEEAKGLTPRELRGIDSKRVAGAVRDLSQSDRRVAARTDQWDTDPWLLGIPGGMVDLRTGQFLEAERTRFMTKRTAVAPQPGTPHLWLQFLKRVTADSDELMEYLHRFSGYALTGNTSEHSLAFLYGTGRNGKGTFFETISRIMGDYAVAAGFEVLAESRHDRHPTELARLHGSRLVVIDETDAGVRWNEGRLKRITGGAKINARFMHKDDFEFEPQFKLLIVGNHKPVIKAVDEAIKRRIHLVPFTVTIPEEERVLDLKERLQAEWPQILNWMIQGCIQWQERRLSPGQQIMAATDAYVEQEDTLGAWLDECCERDGECVSSALFDSYRKWCDAQGEKPWSKKGWGSAMSDRGFTKRKSMGQQIYVGVKTKLGANL